jgi:hypothetical protein
MKKETLEKIIKLQLEGEVVNSNLDSLTNKIMKTIEAFLDDNAEMKYPNILNVQSQRVKTHGDICSCNPINGGSGICGCTIANQPIEVSDRDFFTISTSTGPIITKEGKIYQQINS